MVRGGTAAAQQCLVYPLTSAVLAGARPASLCPPRPGALHALPWRPPAALVKSRRPPPSPWRSRRPPLFLGRWATRRALTTRGGRGRYRSCRLWRSSASLSCRPAIAQPSLKKLRRPGRCPQAARRDGRGVRAGQSGAGGWVALCAGRHGSGQMRFLPPEALRVGCDAVSPPRAWPRAAGYARVAAACVRGVCLRGRCACVRVRLARS